jgi:two-component system chemotaxis sensor kinase CheA
LHTLLQAGAAPEVQPLASADGAADDQDHKPAVVPVAVTSNSPPSPAGVPSVDSNPALTPVVGKVVAPSPAAPAMAVVATAPVAPAAAATVASGAGSSGKGESVAATSKSGNAGVEKQPESPANAAAHEHDGVETAPGAADSSIRVRVTQLDRLMNLAGELVLARNQILQMSSRSADAAVTASAHRLNLITSELQEEIMKVRMQPIATLWSKLPKVVRDLALQLDKRVRVDFVGRDTELDKRLLEAIKDPLTHLVRNACDHGIEPPAERRAKGKNEEGRLLLRAFHEGGRVNIEIRDDGRGIDPEVIREKLIEKGLVTRAEAVLLSNAALIEYVFHPGFSTAKAVTNVSGRGVGMDVVRTNIERIGGTVELHSIKGRGTIVQVRIPLTLAIIPALLVTAGEERFAIPQVNLVELLMVSGPEIKKRIQAVRGGHLIRLRGDLLPLVDVACLLGLRACWQALSGNEDASCNVVVVQAGDQRIGLLVDMIQDTEEIVVKPLDRNLKGINVYAGTTILGDGRIALILDVPGLGVRSGAINPSHKGAPKGLVEASAKSKSQDQHLVVRAGGRRFAFELDAIDRLEVFTAGSIERSGNGEVIQYCGRIMPVMRLDRALGLPEQPASEELHAVVLRTAVRTVGVLVEAIDDISYSSGVEAPIDDHRQLERSTVIDDQVVDVVDLKALFRGEQLVASQQDAFQTKAVRDGQQAQSAQYCTFRAAGLLFGVDVLSVQEVLRGQAMTPVPLAADVLRGILNLRGQTVTAIDLRRCIGLALVDNGRRGEGAMHVVLKTKDGPISVIVDDVGEVLELPSSANLPVPSHFSQEIQRVCLALIPLESDLLLLLDIERLITLGELQIAGNN